MEKRKCCSCGTDELENNFYSLKSDYIRVDAEQLGLISVTRCKACVAKEAVGLKEYIRKHYTLERLKAEITMGCGYCGQTNPGSFNYPQWISSLLGFNPTCKACANEISRFNYYARKANKIKERP